MNATQKIFRVRRNYNQWVNNQTLEDYALRFTAKKARKWSLFKVSNTALGAISFLALEAIGGTITLSYGFDNAVLSIIIVCALIFLSGIPICYYAAKYGVDIDLLTRGAGFGYLGSTATSLIYASFTFIFFALEAAIMAVALQHLFSIPLAIGYLISAIVVIPLVTHGITFISKFQTWTQPLWVALQLLPLVFILYKEPHLLGNWKSYNGPEGGVGDEINIALFGAASAVIFSLIAQIGEQVDYLRFLPKKNNENKLSWWLALISAGPGWVVIGAAKLLIGSFLAYICLQQGFSPEDAADPTQMYTVAFSYVANNQELALIVACVFVILSQLKINITNSYAGSIAWSNFFSRLTHSHPGRVVWLVFNVIIALLLMEIGIYHTLEKTLGAYAIVAVAWLGTLVADLIINKPLKFSPPGIEFRRAYLYDINPVGVGSMLLATILGAACYANLLGEQMKGLSHFITLLSCFIFAPTIAIITKGRFYIAREASIVSHSDSEIECCICQNHYESEDVAHCPAYEGAICSLCCSLDARCKDTCKDDSTIYKQTIRFLERLLPKSLFNPISERIIQFSFIFFTFSFITATLLCLSYLSAESGYTFIDNEISNVLWDVFLIHLIVGGILSWLFVLAHESTVVAQKESQTQNRLLFEEIEAHQQTDFELQQAKDLAESANSAKSRYLTGISHELRTPLNSILGYAQLLEADEEMAEQRRAKISVIRRSGEHLADLIEGLLDVSQIEAGRLQILRDQVRISALLDQLVYMVRLQAEQKGLKFTYICHNKLPDFVYTDEKRLRQILINLISNAIKFTQQGEVTFTIKYRNQVAEFQIIDSGVGIPEHELERIFKPFERIRSPGMPLTPGTGLGLTITRLLTDIMGGEIKVSKNASKGMTFTVLLMLSPVAFPSAEIAPSKKIHGYLGKPKHIAIVDDDPIHRGLISEILSPLGFIVIESSSGVACLESYKDFQPGLYLMDISMPEIDGWETSARLRESGYKGPIIIMSANASESSAIEEDDSVSDYLVKPTKIEPLLEKIRQWLNLEWTYSPLPIASVTYDSDDRISVEGKRPNQEVINELIFLTEIGHLTEIKKQLNDMERDKNIDQSFIQEMKDLARDVQLEKMRMILRNNHE
jgi:signal transduction histidine kinase/CheY-like chemotaxis protein/purine-cytosine permease-like protein